MDNDIIILMYAHKYWFIFVYVIGIYDKTQNGENRLKTLLQS